MGFIIGLRVDIETAILKVMHSKRNMPLAPKSTLIHYKHNKAKHYWFPSKVSIFQ